LQQAIEKHKVNTAEKLPPKTELIKTRAHTRARIKTKNEMQKQEKSIEQRRRTQEFQQTKGSNCAKTSLANQHTILYLERLKRRRKKEE
jgi:hypothetical protein